MCGDQCENMKGGPGWPCGDGQCIKMEWKCKGYRHKYNSCKNRKDHTVDACGANCEDMPNGWACNNGECIKKWYMCDGFPASGNCVPDNNIRLPNCCSDGSDEDSCPGKDNAPLISINELFDDT